MKQKFNINLKIIKNMNLELINKNNYLFICHCRLSFSTLFFGSYNFGSTSFS